MKILILSSSLLLAMSSTSTFASELTEGAFIGTGLGFSTVFFEAKDGYEVDDGSMNLSVRGGTTLNDAHRLYLDINLGESVEFDGYDGVGDASVNTYTLNYEYVHSFNSKFNVFGGGHLGMGTIDVELGNFEDSGSEFVYGLQLGAGWNINDNIEASLSYKYSKVDYSDEYTNKLGIKGLNVALDYKF